MCIRDRHTAALDPKTASKVLSLTERIVGSQNLTAMMVTHNMNCLLYTSLEGDKYYDLAQKYMPNGTCGVISFGLKGGREAAGVFMDKLKLAAIVTHVADARTCVLHPASHTHRQLTDEQLVEAGVAPSMIRFSVGIENADDIIEDIRQALED